VTSDTDVHAGSPPVSRSPFVLISSARRAKDMLARVLVTAAFAVAVIPLLWVLATVIVKGFRAIISSTWWTNSLQGVLPEQFAGGVYHAIYGTLVQAFIAALLAVPLGIMVAVYLVEYGRGRLARATTFLVDVLAGIPSIVAALFVFSVWITTFGFEQSAFAVSLALVLLMLPVVTRSAEEMLRLVPNELREASYALGIPKWKTIVRIVIPTALAGIISGVLLALARVMGETAPVLVLVGYSRAINYDVFDGNMASLPLLMYTELTNPLPAGQLRIWGAAFTLILVIAVLNLAAVAVSRILSRKNA
jgi:phosphate transport system permease protein